MVALPLAPGSGLLLRAYVAPPYPTGRWLTRAAVAVAESGVLVVLPATVVWQAATARGLTTGRSAHVAAVLAAGYAATGSALVPLLGGVVVETVRRPKPHVETVHRAERLAGRVELVRR